MVKDRAAWAVGAVAAPTHTQQAGELNHMLLPVREKKTLVLLINTAVVLLAVFITIIPTAK